MSAYEIAKATQHRQVSCIQVIDAVFQHIEFANKSCNAFSNLDHEGALHAAAKADEMIKSEQQYGPLHGVPFTVKDLLNTSAIPTTYCSKAFEHHRPDKNAVAVGRMIDAGAILIGKTTTPEFALQVATLQSEAISRSKLYKQLEQHFESYNFIITPTVTSEPPLAYAEHDGHVAIKGKRCPMSKWWSHLSIANLTGHPAISIPCGFTRSVFPVGLHAIGRWDDEQSLIDLASTVHELFSWTDYWPELQT
jgi:Asp-tRNA(Asn)/Glu-tRNA(Gln) amidotransferase A subunit family amidase